MKCFFQLIRPADGVRSQAFGESREVFAEILLKRSVENPETMKDLVLVLVEDVAAENWQFSSAPVMTVESFIANFGGKENV